jgi:hypothetical protein
MRKDWIVSNEVGLIAQVEYASLNVKWTYYVLPKRRGETGEPSNEVSIHAS